LVNDFPSRTLIKLKYSQQNIDRKTLQACSHKQILTHIFLKKFQFQIIIIKLIKSKVKTKKDNVINP